MVTGYEMIQIQQSTPKPYIKRLFCRLSILQMIDFPIYIYPSNERKILLWFSYIKVHRYGPRPPPTTTIKRFVSSLWLLTSGMSFLELKWIYRVTWKVVRKFLCNERQFIFSYAAASCSIHIAARDLFLSSIEVN